MLGGLPGERQGFFRISGDSLHGYPENVRVLVSLAQPMLKK